MTKVRQCSPALARQCQPVPARQPASDTTGSTSRQMVVLHMQLTEQTVVFRLCLLAMETDLLPSPVGPALALCVELVLHQRVIRLRAVQIALSKAVQSVLHHCVVNGLRTKQATIFLRGSSMILRKLRQSRLIPWSQRPTHRLPSPHGPFRPARTARCGRIWILKLDRILPVLKNNLH